MADDTAELDIEIAALTLQIAAYNAAVLAFATNGAQQEYRYDTGQQSVRVERADPKALNDILNGLRNQRAVLTTRRDGCGSHNARGQW